MGRRGVLAVAALALNLSVTRPAQAATFSPTGALSGNRAGHTATLLPNGKVLVFGGFNGVLRLTTSELYNPGTGLWEPTGLLATGRTTQTATLLSNGKVLATGGHISSAGSTATCELYNPATGTWTSTGTMGAARGNHTATLLLNGKVLVAGGFNRNTASIVSTAELYDPATGTWTPTGSLATGRDYHTATLLLSGKVLVTGGAPDAAGYSSFASAEVYDPATGTWTTIAPMGSARQAHSASLLPDGRVLVAGGGDVGYFLSTAEVYNPTAGTWTPTGSLVSARGIHSATLLPDGKVLAAGGNYNNFSAPTIISLFSAELYDPATGTWTASGSLNAARSTHVATLLPNGKVLVAAGYYVNNNVQLFSAELYNSVPGPIKLVYPVKLPGGAFQLAFTGAANGTNTVLATTNPALSLTNWTVLGVVPEISPGLFAFSDSTATNFPQRMYTVRSP